MARAFVLVISHSLAAALSFNIEKETQATVQAWLLTFPRLIHKDAHAGKIEMENKEKKLHTKAQSHTAKLCVFFAPLRALSIFFKKAFEK